MLKLKQRISNPMTVIALFATLSETSAAISLPFLESDERQVYIWFLISFPFYLLFLFFVTLNFNYRSLYAPSDFDKDKHFIKAMDTGEPGKTSHQHAPDQQPKQPKNKGPKPAGIRTNFTAQHYVQLPIALRDFHIIDARRMTKTKDFHSFMEKRFEAKQGATRVIVLLIAAESEKVLSEWSLSCLKQAGGHRGTAFCIAYNLSSQDVTLIDQAGQTDPQYSPALQDQ